MENKLYYEALNIRDLYRRGEIDHKEAKLRIKKFEKMFNELSKEKADKYGMKPKLFNFNAFMR